MVFSWVTVPAVLANERRVRREGSWQSGGDSLRRCQDRRRCWYACLTAATLFLFGPHPHNQTEAIGWDGERQDGPCPLSTLALQPCPPAGGACAITTALRRLGHQLRWETSRGTRCSAGWESKSP